jgi:hypothetical protein
MPSFMFLASFSDSLSLFIMALYYSLIESTKGQKQKV